MRLSVKARYGLSATICMAERYHLGECVTISSLAEKLKISKIYLEQVFALLKRAGVVHSVKGAGGGYKLARPPQEITVLAVLTAIETALFEKTETTVLESASAIEGVLQQSIFEPLDRAIAETLSGVNLAELAVEAEKRLHDDGYMYYL